MALTPNDKDPNRDEELKKKSAGLYKSGPSETSQEKLKRMGQASKEGKKK